MHEHPSGHPFVPALFLLAAFHTKAATASMIISAASHSNSCTSLLLAELKNKNVVTVRADHEARDTADSELLSARPTSTSEVNMNLLVLVFGVEPIRALLFARTFLPLRSEPLLTKPLIAVARVRVDAFTALLFEPPTATLVAR